MAAISSWGTDADGTLAWGDCLPVEPVLHRRATLVDLLDRVLDRGVVLQADVVITLAGVPLVGASLRLALAGMETMTRYGVLTDWDQRIRQAAQGTATVASPLAAGESLLMTMPGSYWHSRDNWKAWRPGTIYLTDRHLLVLRKNQPEALLEVALGDIQALGLHHGALAGTDSELPELWLWPATGEPARLRARDPEALKQALAAAASQQGRVLTESHPSFTELAGPAAEVTDVVVDEVMWYRVPAGRALGPTWRRGRLLLTTDRLCWVYSFDDRVLFEARLADLTGAAVEVRDLDGLVGRRPVLVVSHNGSAHHDAALFCTAPPDAEALAAWAEAIRSALPEPQRTSPAVPVPGA